jgi:Protein of unknown function (DUF1403)
MLDGRARAGAQVPFDGAWRRRLALKAAASARIARRGEDEAMLRDAFLLRHGGPPESHGAALLYFTGSKAHNIALRGIGKIKSVAASRCAEAAAMAAFR